jgi:adenylate cyclase
MTEIRLVAATGDARMGALLRGIVARFEAAFPERVHGYYVIGSYGDASSVSTSDLDLDIVFKGRFEGEDERASARDLCDALQAQTAIELDIDIGDEEGLRGGLSPNLKLAGSCIYGEDIRTQYPLLPLST